MKSYMTLKLISEIYTLIIKWKSYIMPLFQNIYALYTDGMQRFLISKAKHTYDYQKLLS